MRGKIINTAISFFLLNRSSMVFALVLSSIATVEAYCQVDENRPVKDVFRVMEIVESYNTYELWPGFRPSEIPIMVFDSLNTLIFNADVPPQGFSEVSGHPGVFIFTGQHPLVRGNSVVRTGDKWIATSVLSSSSVRTGEKYTEKDLAGIIIHEQFHIFQRTNHPRWQPNDGLLLLYPTETEEALFRRRLEKEAFRRAVTAGKKEEIIGWCNEALRQRRQRLGMVHNVYSIYEMELQRTEGLSDYIEKVARGLDPLNSSNITNGIAPAGIRDLGYVEGRWIAMILDKVKPGWKSIMEKTDTLYLEEILETVTNDYPQTIRKFTASELEEIKAETTNDILKWREKKKTETERFYATPGFRLEIDASSKPLNILIFEPLEIETLENRSVYHRLIFMARNETGNVRIMNHSCITWFDGSLRIEKLVITGLKETPEVNSNENKIMVRNSNITLELKYSVLDIDNNGYVIKL